MKLHTFAAACAALVSLSATAAMAAEPVVVKLAQPVSAPTKFIAGGAMFFCEADACQATASTSDTFSAATCKIVAGKVGPVLSFEGRKAFEAARLSDCNSVAVAHAAGAQMAKK